MDGGKGKQEMDAQMQAPTQPSVALASLDGGKGYDDYMNGKGNRRPQEYGDYLEYQKSKCKGQCSRVDHDNYIVRKGNYIVRKSNSIVRNNYIGGKGKQEIDGKGMQEMDGIRTRSRSPSLAPTLYRSRSPSLAPATGTATASGTGGLAGSMAGGMVGSTDVFFRIPVTPELRPIPVTPESPRSKKMQLRMDSGSVFSSPAPSAEFEDSQCESQPH